jgi:3'(2'), 5'-bisphosphate nucleotidase
MAAPPSPSSPPRPSPDALGADHRLAAELATRAGALLRELRRALADGEDPDRVRAEGDRRSHELLVEALAADRPHDAVLSEEGDDDPARLDAERVWIVDPLDGTREFGEPGRVDWAVHVALAVDGAPVVGAVALPAVDLVLATGRPPDVPDAVGGPPRVVVSRTRPPAAATHVTGALGGVLVEMGSAGAKAMAVVRGAADVYVHSGGQYEWDSCAPVAVALAAGLHASRIDGSPLLYNRPDPTLPDLVVCRAELAPPVLEALAPFSSGAAGR